MGKTLDDRLIEKQKLLTTEELEHYLKVTNWTLYRLKDKGFPAYKIGSQLRYKESEVIDWLCQHRYPNKASKDRVILRYDKKEMPIPLMTMDEVAEYLSFNYYTIHRHVQKDLPAFLVGGQIRIDGIQLGKWLDKHLKV